MAIPARRYTSWRSRPRSSGEAAKELTYHAHAREDAFMASCFSTRRAKRLATRRSEPDDQLIRCPAGRAPAGRHYM